MPSVVSTLFIPFVTQMVLTSCRQSENLSKIAENALRFWKCIRTNHFLRLEENDKCLLLTCEHSYS